MKLVEKHKEAQEVMNNVITKCWKNETFKKNLVASPIATIEKFTGKPVHIPKDKELVVIDQTDNRYIYFNIPSESNLEEMELTDEQLELVAGGEGALLLGAAIFTAATSTYLLYRATRQ